MCLEVHVHVQTCQTAEFDNYTKSYANFQIHNFLAHHVVFSLITSHQNRFVYLHRISMQLKLKTILVAQKNNLSEPMIGIDLKYGPNRDALNKTKKVNLIVYVCYSFNLK